MFSLHHLHQGNVIAGPGLTVIIGIIANIVYSNKCFFATLTSSVNIACCIASHMTISDYISKC